MASELDVTYAKRVRDRWLDVCAEDAGATSSPTSYEPARDTWSRAKAEVLAEDHEAAMAEDMERSSPEVRRARQLAEVRATEAKALAEVAAWGRILRDAVALREKLEAWPAKPKGVAFRGHDFEASYSGMVCGAMVELPDGSGDQCGEPVFSPIHDPREYLRYAGELRAALAEWRSSSLLAGKPHPF